MTERSAINATRTDSALPASVAAPSLPGGPDMPTPDVVLAPSEELTEQPVTGRDQNRSKVIVVRVSSEEKAAIKQLSLKSKLTVSDYCRRTAMNARIRPPLDKNEREGLANLVSLGGNLNQLTRYTHQHKGINSELGQEIRTVLKQLDVLLNKYFNRKFNW